MKIEEVDGKIERKIIMGMVTNKEVLSKIAPQWSKEGLFRNKWCNIIGGWCVRFFLKYGKAPKASIEPVFDKWSRSADRDTAKLVERFLGSLSGEYEQAARVGNPSHTVDLAAGHFREVQIQRLEEDLQHARERGKIDEALNKINSFSSIELGEVGATDILSDQEALRSAFEEKTEPLIVLPGCLGHFLNHLLTVDSFVAFTAPEKTGKSFWLQELAWEAMLQRKRVAHFVIGDMSKGQVLKRYAAKAAGRPLRACKPNEPVRYPKLIAHQEGDKYATIEYKERNFKKDLEWGIAWKAFEGVALSKVKSKTPYLRLSCHPGGSVSVLGIKSIVQGWGRNGWVPEVLVLDYADNLAAIDGKEETRHQINRTWRELRSLAQEFHNLVLTATQSSTASYNSYVIKREHFSENKMKNAHVNAMIGINQSDEEKEMDVTRLNIVQAREMEFNRNKCVHVAGCRAIGRVAIKSCY